MSFIISVKNLKVEFQTKDTYVQALKGISFDINKGEVLGVVGESGSGKSVTALSIMRLLAQPPGKITSGEIFFENKDLLKCSEKDMRKIQGNRISMIFQEPMTSLNPVFTIGYQIAEALMLHQHKTKREAINQAIDLLDQVGIQNPSIRINSYPHEMSGGQRQRVMIAIAIACQPDLLIADEPTTSLDVTIQKQIINLLKDLQKKMTMSILFISHDLGVIGEIAQRVLVMNKGYIVESNTTQRILQKPQETYTKGLISCRPSLDTQMSRLPTMADFLKGPKHKPQITLKKPRKPTGEVLLKVQNLKKYFPLKKSFFKKNRTYIRAVDDVSFEIEKGSTLGLVGESGCGKTTLGRTLLHLIPASSGQVLYNNIDLATLNKKDMKSMRKKIQIIFQDPYASLNPRMTIGSSIMEPMIIHNMYSNYTDRVAQVERLLEQVELNKNMKNRYPHEFSGGQRQRICIARAIAMKPEFLICDESVSSLDVSIQAQILNLLKDLQEEMNLTYVFISHDLTVVRFISDNIAVMNKGRIIEYNKSEDIYKNPQQDYTRKLIEAIPKMSKTLTS